MAQHNAPILLMFTGSMVLGSLPPSAAVAGSGSVRTPHAACERIKAEVASLGQFDVRNIAFCDIIGRADSPRGYYVLALHSKRPDCDGICSTNMGWFAVHKTSGRVFEWDVAESMLGAPIDRQP